MINPNTVICKNRQEWRKWLEKNHNSVKEIWLVYYKKHTKMPTVTYDEAVEEALCFGWIDSTVRTIDSEKYCQKFTPRNKKSNWSDSNKLRIQKLLKEGLMADSGLEKIEGIDIYKLSKNEVNIEQLKLPEQFESELKTNKIAYENFKKLAPSHQKQYINWIMFAKKEETQIKRLNEAIKMLENNQKIGLK
ncbi:MAG: hypothetical protein A2046_03865 [Bacteroidetes bacterium GWA2_30_7]|nr:MAG: hypothetical protein A2046_03865 [Bacteroidetes bacterium GWA2_30_7]